MDLVGTKHSRLMTRAPAVVALWFGRVCDSAYPPSARRECSRSTTSSIGDLQCEFVVCSGRLLTFLLTPTHVPHLLQSFCNCPWVPGETRTSSTSIWVQSKAAVLLVGPGAFESSIKAILLECGCSVDVDEILNLLSAARSEMYVMTELWSSCGVHVHILALLRGLVNCILVSFRLRYTRKKEAQRAFAARTGL